MFKKPKKIVSTLLILIFLMGDEVMILTGMLFSFAVIIMSLVIKIMDGKTEIIEIPHDAAYTQQLRYVNIIDTFMVMACFGIMEMSALILKYWS